MRIAHVGVEIVPSRNGAYVGGLVKNVATVAAGQAARGHDVSLFTSDVRGHVADGGKSPLGTLRRIPTQGEYGSFPFAATFAVRAARELRRANRATPFDIVHVHSAYAALGAVSYLLRGVDAPRVFSLYSPNFRTMPGHDCGTRRRLVRDRAARTALAGYDATVVPSGSLRSRLLESGLDGESVFQIPPALAPSMLDGLPSREEARRTLSISGDARVVLFLGNYSPWKGADVLLHAFSRLRDAVPDAVLLAAWGEPYEWSGNRRSDLLALVEGLGLEGSVRQVGILEDVRLALRAADVLASPFRCTCKVLDYPLSILEAFACERPVVSTRVGGIPELFEGDGRGTVVPPGDADALANALTAVIADPAAASEAGVRASRWVRERFLDRTVGKAIESLYGDLDGARPAPRANATPAPN
ncbi:MAG: hypothetical protein A3K68_04365 [Euryarchaeota archaeon RBG_16_68_13]|nr:MAG: hypothetical protein A3K68_04365 [Euryarchaeota archaeon RBG_16_68_13]